MVTTDYQAGDPVRVRVGRGTVTARLVTAKLDRRGRLLVEIDNGSEERVVAPVRSDDLIAAAQG